MIRMLSIVCALAVLAAMPARAADPIEKPNSPAVDVRLSEPLVVGTTLLPPGAYEFQCRLAGDKEYLVVTSAADGREVARVPCRPEELKDKIVQSDIRSMRKPAGPRELTAVRIKGEKVAHTVGTE